ncbi:hypothetical protein C2I33_24730 [Ralstonia solanacearum]|nr:hypothetical protein C2I33_24730 [Ralstonia solanacearum]
MPSPPLSLLSLSHAFTPNLVLENLKSFISQPSNIGGLSILQTTQILKQLSRIYMWEVPSHKIADRQTQVRIFVRGIVPPEDCPELLKVVRPQPMSSGAQHHQEITYARFPIKRWFCEQPLDELERTLW